MQEFCTHKSFFFFFFTDSHIMFEVMNQDCSEFASSWIGYVYHTFYRLFLHYMKKCHVSVQCNSIFRQHSQDVYILSIEIMLDEFRVKPLGSKSKNIRVGTIH